MVERYGLVEHMSEFPAAWSQFLDIIAVVIGTYAFGLFFVWAPLKLFNIQAELEKLNAEAKAQTKLLAALAKVPNE